MIKLIREWFQMLRFRLFQDGVADDYFMRHIGPEIQRAKALGIPSSEIREMWERAVHEADPATGLGAAPRFRNLIDRWHFSSLTVRARDLGMPQYVFEHTWADALQVADTEHPALDIMVKFLDDWEAGHVHLL